MAPSERPFRNAYRSSRLSANDLIPPKFGMPLSMRPSRTHLLKSSRDSVFRSSTSEGPTRPSWLAPWQRSQASARQVRHPFIVLASTWLPSTTWYGGAAPFAPAAGAAAGARVAAGAGAATGDGAAGGSGLGAAAGWSGPAAGGTSSAAAGPAAPVSAATTKAH